MQNDLTALNDERSLEGVPRILELALLSRIRLGKVRYLTYLIT